MAYVLNGVITERSARSMRPREPAPPSRAFVSSSPMMATRALRPREPVRVRRMLAQLSGMVQSTQTFSTTSATTDTATTSTGASTVTAPIVDKYLALVGKYRGQQAELEKLLKKIGYELSNWQKTLHGASLRNDVKMMKIAQDQINKLNAAASMCITYIRDCAGEATKAAYSAIATGASQAEVQKAAAAGAAGGGSSYPAPSSGEEVVVETSTVTVSPSGELVPGSDARPVNTPSTESTATTDLVPSGPPPENLTPTIPVEVVKAASSNAGWIIFGIAALVGWKILKGGK